MLVIRVGSSRCGIRHYGKKREVEWSTLASEVVSAGEDDG